MYTLHLKVNFKYQHHRRSTKHVKNAFFFCSVCSSHMNKPVPYLYPRPLHVLRSVSYLSWSISRQSGPRRKANPHTYLALALTTPAMKTRWRQWEEKTQTTMKVHLLVIGKLPATNGSSNSKARKFRSRFFSSSIDEWTNRNSRIWREDTECAFWAPHVNTNWIHDGRTVSHCYD